MTTCPRCGSTADEAGWCAACQQRVGSPAVVLVEKRSSSRRPRRWLVRRKYLHLTAALMSLLIPGAGQVYKGRFITGAAWFVIVVAAYLLIGPPALIIHLMCVVTAGSAARVRRRVVVARPASWVRPPVPPPPASPSPSLPQRDPRRTVREPGSTPRDP
jgi:hypothetical protein